MSPTQADSHQMSLVDRVVQTVRTRILDGEYPPGSRLKLQTIAEDSGTSLIPVREALRVLEAERLVETIPNKGARVTPLSLNDMRDLYNVRILLEVDCLRQTEGLQPGEVSSLEELLDEMTAAVSNGEIDRVMQLHRQYHYALYAHANSSWLLYLIDLLWTHTERYQRLSLAKRSDGGDHEHRSILGALARGDSEAAAEHLRSHLTTTAELVARAYEENDANLAS